MWTVGRWWFIAFLKGSPFLFWGGTYIRIYIYISFQGWGTVLKFCLENLLGITSEGQSVHLQLQNRSQALSSSGRVSVGEEFPQSFETKPPNLQPMELETGWFPRFGFFFSGFQHVQFEQSLFQKSKSLGLNGQTTVKIRDGLPDLGMPHQIFPFIGGSENSKPLNLHHPVALTLLEKTWSNLSVVFFLFVFFLPTRKHQDRDPWGIYALNGTPPNLNHWT